MMTRNEICALVLGVGLVVSLACGAETTAADRLKAGVKVVCTTVAATEKANNPKYLASHRNIQKAFAAAPERPTVLFGDSLTAHLRHKGRCEYIKAHVNAAVNAGISGDRIEDLLWRLVDMLPALKAKPPKLATVMIGTNNLRESYSVEDVFEGQKNIVRIIRENCPETKIIVFAIPPLGVNHKLCPRPRPAEINRLTRTLADDENVFFFDFSELLVNEDATELVDDFYLKDRVHFSDKGCAEAVMPFLAGAIRLVLSPTRPKDYTRQLSKWRDGLEVRYLQAVRDHAEEEQRRVKALLRGIPRSLMKEFSALEKDPNYVPQLPEECLRQN